MNTLRIAIVGHFTYFQNHFPEHWREDENVRCFDVDERSYGWMANVKNFKPDITVFFRPELYPHRSIVSVPGIRVAYLSEPIPSVSNGKLNHTSETNIRLAVYKRMDWSAFHWRVYYDPGKRESAEILNFQIDEYRPLTIDTSSFFPAPTNSVFEYDVCFVGKATPLRISALDFLRSSRLRFIWVAHGLSGMKLANLFRNSELVLNVHADGMPASEPRIDLALACGRPVLTQPVSTTPSFLPQLVHQHDLPWSSELILNTIKDRPKVTNEVVLNALRNVSTRTFIDDVFSSLRTWA